MRIGHSRCISRYLMEKEEAPTSEVCSIELAVKHIITEYLKYERERQNIKIVPILDPPLGPDTEDNFKMIAFLKTTNLYDTI